MFDEKRYIPIHCSYIVFQIKMSGKDRYNIASTFHSFALAYIYISKFYRRHFDLVSKYNVGLKTLLLQGLSEPGFYGDVMYKFRNIICKNDFPFHFNKIIFCYKKIGYNIDVLRQTACLVVNPIKVNNFAYLFNCTTVGRASDGVTVPSVT